ncbi:NAD(P)/FAD-dependent oxidoreductase [Candidatus Halocynthiibacter alkanivorans]|uniref:NAD(P)/FAD-dependent oxidoreductase n=1 Tax=Candidatus Halocynthiibacter alkanivorans TaxID=2267619 RepID=UPI000DF3BFD2|nr:FAD-binding oxidoreductase [Candidatus Halocynthiibacter alkanivorans]
MGMNTKSTPRKNGGAGHAVVVGAGIIGAATALNLQRRGFDVTIVDALPPGEGASFGNAGIAARCAIVPVPVPGILKKFPAMLMDPMGPLSIDFLHVARNAKWFIDYLRHGRASEVERIAGELFKLTDGSIDEHLELARDTGGEPWVTERDYLYIYPKRSDFEAEAFAWDIRRRHGIEYFEVGAAELREMEPDLAPGFTFAVRLPQHGFALDPAKLVKGLVETFQKRGGRLLQAKAHAFEIGAEGAHALITEAGTVPFDRLVIAAGAWSATLAGQLGTRIPLMSERGYHIQFPNPGIRQNHPMMVTSGKYVATPMTGGLRLAGMVEFKPMNAPPDPRLTDRLKRHARLLFPAAELDDAETWMGHRPSLPDSLPVIGAVPGHPNVFLAFGHQHIGLSTGPRTGRLVAQLVAGEQMNEDLTAFRADRF